MSYGGGSKCPKCMKSVYSAEEAPTPVQGHKFHKLCFRCEACNKMLDSVTVAEHELKLYCKQCHGKFFGPKGYGFGGGAGTLGMDCGERHGGVRPPNQPSTVAQAYSGADYQTGPPPEGSDICPRCGKAVYQAEKRLAANHAWHIKCFCCAYCGKSVDSTNVRDREHEIFCQACYAKGFGPVGVGYGQGAGTLGSTT
ncbi:cysteine and glycine-rich protein 1-like isoform X2 [Asterias rubens]|uniref:cysteine and glycine-rich protein 1-like n=1 Tax=Asterias amurensis TaxID=7602 RepID=UPI0014555FCB|nr:cysteine and glycine-rich protein 1-like isoform X1 [Asterias rubens]XP_033645537.1 cysteine and glycine-rich protein 1-like isoform X2 [Asterias rubens]